MQTQIISYLKKKESAKSDNNVEDLLKTTENDNNLCLLFQCFKSCKTYLL